MALIKADIVEAVQTEIGFTKHKSTELVEDLLETIKSTLASGEDVLVSGFGKFNVNDKRERRGRNPSTGEDKMIAAR
jgi:integration host factor subunit alpha